MVAPEGDPPALLAGAVAAAAITQTENARTNSQRWRAMGFIVREEWRCAKRGNCRPRVWERAGARRMLKGGPAPGRPGHGKAPRPGRRRHPPARDKRGGREENGPSAVSAAWMRRRIRRRWPSLPAANSCAREFGPVLRPAGPRRAFRRASGPFSY